MEPKDINFAAMPQTAVNVVTKPAEFFQGMSKTGGFLEPLVFAVIMGFIAGAVHAIIGLFGVGYGAAYGGGAMSGFRMIIIMPIAVAVGSFIGAGILYLIWKLMGSREDYEAAYRCGAYLTALTPITAVISLVPYVGGLANMAIFVFYLVYASIHVQKIPARKAWLVFGIIGLIFALLGVFSEYRVRSMTSSMDPWRKMGEDMRKEYRESARDRDKSTDEIRKQTEELAKRYQRQAEEAQKESE